MALIRILKKLSTDLKFKSKIINKLDQFLRKFEVLKSSNNINIKNYKKQKI